MDPIGRQLCEQNFECVAPQHPPLPVSSSICTRLSDLFSSVIDAWKETKKTFRLCAISSRLASYQRGTQIAFPMFSQAPTVDHFLTHHQEGKQIGELIKQLINEEALPADSEEEYRQILNRAFSQGTCYGELLSYSLSERDGRHTQQDQDNTIFFEIIYNILVAITFEDVEYNAEVQSCVHQLRKMVKSKFQQITFSVNKIEDTATIGDFLSKQQGTDCIMTVDGGIFETWQGSLAHSLLVDTKNLRLYDAMTGLIQYTTLQDLIDDLVSYVKENEVQVEDIQIMIPEAQGQGEKELPADFNLTP